MATEHNVISDGTTDSPYDGERHEPRGMSRATKGYNYCADGAGSGNWDISPFGFVYFENIGSPYTLTYPATFTKLAPTTIQPGVSHKVTEGTNARLTYLGDGEVMDVVSNISVDQSTGANRDLEFAIYKNGAFVPGSKGIVTTTSGEKHHLSLEAAIPMTINDYIEVYAQNDGGSGDIKVYTFALYLDPH